MNRRSFNKLVGLGTAGSLGAWPMFPQFHLEPFEMLATALVEYQ
jgi:hypothetical protein